MSSPFPPFAPQSRFGGLWIAANCAIADITNLVMIRQPEKPVDHAPRRFKNHRGRAARAAHQRGQRARFPAFRVATSTIAGNSGTDPEGLRRLESRRLAANPYLRGCYGPGGRVDRNHRPLPRPLFKTHANFGGSDRRRASQAAHRAASIVATGLGIDGHGEGGSIETIDPCRDRCSRHTRILAAAIDGGRARLLIEPRRSSPRGWASTGMGREGRSKPSTPAETVVQDTREFWRQRSTEGKPGCSSSRVDRRHGAGHRRAWGGRVDRNHRPLPRPLFKTHANFGGSAPCGPYQVASAQTAVRSPRRRARPFRGIFPFDAFQDCCRVQSEDRSAQTQYHPKARTMNLAQHYNERITLLLNESHGILDAAHRGQREVDLTRAERETLRAIGPSLPACAQGSRGGISRPYARFSCLTISKSVVGFR